MFYPFSCNEIFVSILRYLIIFTEDARNDRVAFQGEPVVNPVIL